MLQVDENGSARRCLLHVGRRQNGDLGFGACDLLAVGQHAPVADNANAGALHEVGANEQLRQNFLADAGRIAHGDADSGD